MEIITTIPAQDPVIPNWTDLELPDTWLDRLNLRSPRDLWHLLRRWLGPRKAVQLAEQMPGRALLPKYLLQEFHNLPNGNYSKQFTHGYIVGFDRAMLGYMRHARRRIAEFLQPCNAALDVGTAGGAMAAELRNTGIADVWGLDPSPYLLQHAARTYPDVNFVQGLAERTEFPDARFDGISACFVFHEIPPRYIETSLREFNRILRPGGLLAICEPSALQWQRSSWQSLRHGLRAAYFYLLARLVHEPFLEAWHRCDFLSMLVANGFELIADEQSMPVRYIFARKAVP